MKSSFMDISSASHKKPCLILPTSQPGELIGHHNKLNPISGTTIQFSYKLRPKFS